MMFISWNCRTQILRRRRSTTETSFKELEMSRGSSCKCEPLQIRETRQARPLRLSRIWYRHTRTKRRTYTIIFREKRASKTSSTLN